MTPAKLATLLVRALRAAADVIEHGIEEEPAPDTLVWHEDVGVTRVEWSRAIKRGELRASLVGRRKLARRSDVEAWLAARSQPAFPAPPAPESGPRPRTSNRVDESEIDRALNRARKRPA